MTERRRYRRKPDQFVVAIQLRLKMDALIYSKWGSEQRCKPGDWIVDNNGDIYTVDADVFERTYREVHEVHRGVYQKITPVWAEPARTSGQVASNSGLTQYHQGDYLVFNNEVGSDAYAMTAGKFESSYELDE